MRRRAERNVEQGAEGTGRATRSTCQLAIRLSFPLPGPLIGERSGRPAKTNCRAVANPQARSPTRCCFSATRYGVYSPFDRYWTALPIPTVADSVLRGGPRGTCSLLAYIGTTALLVRALDLSGRFGTEEVA